MLLESPNNDMGLAIAIPMILILIGGLGYGVYVMLLSVIDCWKHHTHH